MSIESFRGSCLCGDVAYEVSGEVRGFYHCHCSRCRKSSGTGHASNIIVITDDVTWTRGEEKLARYNVPEAKRFAAVFCTRCGSMMPRHSPEAHVVAIPAGTLDHEPLTAPAARIFMDSRAQWSCDDHDVPQFANYPT